jgi:GAF domain-containing protein
MGEVRWAGRSPEAKLDALYRLGQALVLLRDEQAIVDTVLEIAGQVLDFQDSEFLLVDQARRELVVVAQRGEFHLAAGLRIPLDGERGIAAAAARTGQPVYVPDVRGDPRYVHAGFPAVSELAVPVQIEGRLLGAINVESREPDAFTCADVRLLSTLASQAALALENARLYGRERRRVEELAAVNRVARRVSGSLDLQELDDGPLLLVGGEHQYLAPRALGRDPAGGVQPVEAGHGDVHHGHVGLQFPRQLDRLLACSRLSNHVHVRLVLQYLRRRLSHDRVVVRQQDADSAHRPSPP